MGMASFMQGSFLGGEWSQTAQGQIADPKYKISMSSCLNGLPLETGAWTRRPGTRFIATTRNGVAGRLVPFDFKENAPYNIEFTDAFLRFFNGDELVTTNDAQAISSISTANPAVVQLSATMPSDWATGQSFIFTSLGTNNPTLQNRVFTGTKVDGTHISLVDPISAQTIDGSTLGTFVSGNLARVMEVATPYAAGSWATLRSVQAEVTAILLQSSLPPYSLTVTSMPTGATPAAFALNQSVFIDGPYFDPPTNGVQVTPSAVSGIVTLTLAFPAYSSTQAYAEGNFVTSSSVNYISLIDQNVGNTPASSATAWSAVSAATAIGPDGFTGTDIGRHVRLFSEPPTWVVGGSYVAGNVVTYFDNTGSKKYYTALSTTTGALTNAPGTSATAWGVNPNAVIWTWGKITGLVNQISQSLSGSVNIGTLTNAGGVAAAFDGVINQTSLQGAAKYYGPSGVGPGTTQTSDYIGKNYSGASSQTISSVTVFPSTDLGMVQYGTNGPGTLVVTSMIFNLRAKQTAPSNSTDGTLLGTTTVNGAPYTSPVSISSSDQSTAWAYVWVEILCSYSYANVSSGYLNVFTSEVQFFAPAGTGSSSGIKAEILGPPLLYTTTIATWRLGIYSGTVGWPTCGTYHEGRLWLSGSISNRFDGSRPVQIAQDGTIPSFSFAPTEADGTVSDSCAIDYTLDGPQVNAILWMQPDAAGIIMGTQGGEWLVQASSNNNILTPTSIQSHLVTKIGCANIEPRRTEHTNVIVHKHQRKIVEYFADVFSGKFTAPNLSEKAKHLTLSGIEEIAYQQELVPTIWARCGDGSLIGAVYKRDTLMTSQGPTAIGWHRHELGSGRLIESICGGPSSDGTLDSVSMVTNDPVTDVRHIEVMTNIPDESTTLATGWFLDDAVVPYAYTVGTVGGGAPGIIVTGLWHLNGKTVSAWCGGLDAGDWTVSNGSIGIPFAQAAQQPNILFTAAFVSNYAGAMPIVVGFTYTSQGQLLRPDMNPESGAHNGPGFGKVKRIHKFAALLVNTQGIKFGVDFGTSLHAAQLKTPGGSGLLPANTLFSGIHKDTMADTAEMYASRVSWQITRPFPATVAGISGFIETVDE